MVSCIERQRQPSKRHRYEALQAIKLQPKEHSPHDNLPLSLSLCELHKYLHATAFYRLLLQ